jgi:tetratricopeptide (TPR) repeat protein
MSRISKKRRLEKAAGEGDARPGGAGVNEQGSKRLFREKVWVCAGLVVLVLTVFGQTVGHGFVNYDDDVYVYANPVVSKGFSISGIEWAFTHIHAENWHPLTTIVHMLDCQIFGLWAGGHHLVNVLLHAAVAVMLFLLLVEITGEFWRSAFVAAVFAIHPLRVESVAWVAELKDVLSGLFFMLTLRAYVRWARRGEGKGSYAMVVLWFVLGLLSKPMLVTVPFVLLLLDYWPLGRLQRAAELPKLLWEKAPLFALSLLSCIATILAQTGAIATVARVPLPARAGNALVACVTYLGKLIWPGQLAALYPLLKSGPPVWEWASALLLLLALTAAVLLSRRRYPYRLTGWLWYLGMLVPVIGLLQVGQQAYADRYTYLPQIGVCFGVTWTAADWAGERPLRRAVLAGIAVVVLCAFLVGALIQTSYWRDSETLWVHTLSSTRDNYVARNDLGVVFFNEGRTDEAIDQYREAVQIEPDDAEAHNNLGFALLQERQVGAAMSEFQAALRAEPTDLEAANNMGIALAVQGRTAEAINEFRAVLKMDPQNEKAYKNLQQALRAEASPVPAAAAEK